MVLLPFPPIFVYQVPCLRTHGDEAETVGKTSAMAPAGDDSGVEKRAKNSETNTPGLHLSSACLLPDTDGGKGELKIPTCQSQVLCSVLTV